jgi:hypothetical protein
MTACTAVRHRRAPHVSGPSLASVPTVADVRVVVGGASRDGLRGSRGIEWQRTCLRRMMVAVMNA